MKTKITIIALATLCTVAGFAQEKTGKCKCFDKKEYDAFVTEEQHQTVVEGNDAQLTVLMSRAQKEDITIVYKIIPGTAKLNDDVVIPKNNTFTIPAGKTQATIHIPTVKDQFSELDETFSIQIVEGYNAVTKRKLNNNNLLRTRTIVDKPSAATHGVNIFLESGVIKSNPEASTMTVRNINGILLNNKNLSGGTYFINAVINGESISKTVMVTQ